MEPKFKLLSRDILLSRRDLFPYKLPSDNTVCMSVNAQTASADLCYPNVILPESARYIPTWFLNRGFR